MEKALAKKERLIAAKGKPIKESKPKPSKEKPKAQRAKSLTKVGTKRENPKPKLTPEELKAFRVELMAKARAAKKAKEGGSSAPQNTSWYNNFMKRIDARKLRPAIGGGFIIQTEEGQQYITGREREWNGSSWMGYPCDENERIIYHQPAVEVFPVYSAGRVVGYVFRDSKKE